MTTPQTIIEAVCQVFPVTPADITGPRRRRTEADTRKLAAFVMHEQLRMTDSEIGMSLGNRPRTCVQGARVAHPDLYATDRQYRRMCDQVFSLLGIEQAVAA